MLCSIHKKITSTNIVFSSSSFNSFFFPRFKQQKTKKKDPQHNRKRFFSFFLSSFLRGPKLKIKFVSKILIELE